MSYYIYELLCVNKYSINVTLYHSKVLKQGLPFSSSQPSGRHALKRGVSERGAFGLQSQQRLHHHHFLSRLHAVAQLAKVKDINHNSALLNPISQATQTSKKTCPATALTANISQTIFLISIQILSRLGQIICLILHGLKCLIFYT